jgi:hypothetical protein
MATPRINDLAIDDPKIAMTTPDFCKMEGYHALCGRSMWRFFGGGILPKTVPVLI